MITYELNWREAMMLHATLMARFKIAQHNGLDLERSFQSASAIIELESAISAEIGSEYRKYWENYLATYDHQGGSEGANTLKVIRALEIFSEKEAARLARMNERPIINYSSDA